MGDFELDNTVPWVLHCKLQKWK